MCFRIPYLKKPEAIDMDPRIAELLDKNVTVVFRLPFKDSLLPEDISNLENHLYNLERKRSLLFLRHLKTIQWYDEKNGQMGSYVCLRPDKPRNPSQVELKASLNGESQPSETFLVFRKEIQPQEGVINRLQDQAENLKEEDRIQRSREELQSIEGAFKLQDGKITTLDGCMLFAYLPTEIKTNLRFLIQARYQTTPSRENIVKPSESLWNRWLLQETANFLPEVLEQLKDCGLLDPIFFNVLPLKEDNVPEEFDLVVEALQKTMQEKAFVPTEKGGHYTKAEKVFYPDSTPLRRLVKSSGMYSDNSLLHPDIQNNEKFRRCFKVIREAGVEPIRIGRVLTWLERQSVKWFEARSNEWLCSLYTYLKEQKSQLERIKKLPLVRREDGQHVCANDQLVYFPPDTNEERQEIEPFLNELPVLQSALLEGAEWNEIEPFLRNHLGIRVLHPENMIRKWIIPQYSRSDKPHEKENLLHVRYLFKVWDRLSGYEHRNLRKEISETPILWTYNGVQPKTSDFVKPCDAYLPKIYTGNDHLEAYFSVYDGDIWFVDSGYLHGNSNPKEWLKFLKTIGAQETPRVNEVQVLGNSEECEERGITWQRSTREFENGDFIDRYYSGHFDGAIEDFEFAGLMEIFNQISDHNKVNLSRSLWSLLIKAIEPLSSEKKSRWPRTSSRDAFFQCTYRWFFNGPKENYFDATFCRQLKKTAWLPDEQSNLHRPSELFAPTDSNRRVLGDSVAYLHPDFDVSRDNEIGRWLAEKLEVHLNANTDSVLNYLQTLSGTEANVKKVEPLYRFLERQDARPHEEFKKNPLIFTSNPEPSWWRTDKVFWKDECELFKNKRGYLKVHYPEILKPFFMALGVSEQASQLEYAHGIQEIATTEQAREEEVRARVRRLYTTLTSWQADQWKIIYNRNCWLGKKGNEWEFFSRNELVRNDHPYIADIFEGEVPFWTFDDLLELTRYLKIEGCSQAKVEFHPEGDQEEDTDLSIKIRNLRPYIHAFLNSQGLCEAPAEGKSADVLNLLSVRFVEELKTTYTLKEISLTSPNPRPSFLAVTNEEVTIWLALAADKDDYASLIGDALQDYFGVKDLGRFTEHLLTKTIDTVLNRWKRDGLRTDLCLSSPNLDSKEGDKNTSESVGKKLSDETSNGDDSGQNDSDVKVPTVNGNPEIDDGAPNSTTKGSGTRTYNPSGTSGTSRSGGHSLSTSSNGGSGGHGGSGGGGEGPQHRKLKHNLADNPSPFGEGLKLDKIEYIFGSGDKVDILLRDSYGNPVTVEVETGFSSGSGRYVGIWQAVKYQHLAAMECGLACEQVRSILAAPEIPDDVKTECEKLGIEPIEVSNQVEDTDE